ncbi:MAG: DNA polymerase III subunit delta' [Pseudohongiella sp.]|nr:DNA polymerase III subunit delta' [Pseudohongiella sp.]
MSTVLPWHEDAWHQIQSQIRSGRLPHAILLQGLPGSGRRQFADALCAHLLCESEADKPCGRCRQCMLYNSGNHPDVLVLEPEEKSKSIKIDQIRRLSLFVAQTSNQSNVTKLIVIRPAEALGPAAANSLLKSLEEPPGRTLFMLIAEPGTALLPTIRSRCQPVALAGAGTEQAMAWLQLHSSAAVDDLAAALQLAPGSPVAALALLEQSLPAWRAGIEERLSELASGRLSPVELAKLASTQPALRAIHLIEEISARDSRAFIQSHHMQDLRRELVFQHKLLPVKQQLNSTANPNELMALEYLLIEYAGLLKARTGT